MKFELSVMQADSRSCELQAEALGRLLINKNPILGNSEISLGFWETLALTLPYIPCVNPNL